MGMPAQHTEWTAEMVRALPEDGNRYEVLDGELLVSPAPRHAHQRALRLLFELLAPYVHGHRLGEVLWSPADIEFSKQDLVQPDLFVIPAPLADQVKDWSDVTALLLVVEILSTSTAFGDRNRKRPAYQKQRIPEYWIVDLDARLVERWKPDDTQPEVLLESLEWLPHPDVAPLRIDLHRYFAQVQAFADNSGGRFWQPSASLSPLPDIR
jgi:Uma2 family endonuclease